MRKLRAIALALAVATPAAAQDLKGNEIIVTGARREADNYDSAIPAIGLRRIADYAVQQVTVAGDTRDGPRRRDEIFAMIKGAIERSGGKTGIELATGEMVVEPLTLANYRNLKLVNDGRPDTDRTTFLVKTRMAANGDAKAALDRIDAFIKSVPPVGRAEIKATDDLTLSIVDPDQYRGQIVDLVAADARATAARLGPDYAVEAKGLDRPVEWSRASLTEVFLYVPYSYSVVPGRR